MKLKKPPYLITAIGYDGRIATSQPTKNYQYAKIAFELLVKFAEHKKTIAEITLHNGDRLVEKRTFEKEININENDNRI